MTEISAIVEKHRGERGDLIAILEDIQEKYSYLPEEALRTVASETGRPLADVYGVATFYKWFSLKPRGKHVITCCVGTACHVRGARRIADEFERRLQVLAGETTAGGEFTLETQNCLGGCALGPIVVVDGHYFANVGSSAVPSIIRRAEEGLTGSDAGSEATTFPLEVACARCDRSLLDHGNQIDGHPSIEVSIAFGGRKGRLLLSSLYGSPTSKTELDIPERAEVDFFCPHCAAAMEGAGRCDDCGARMIPLVVRGGGILQICARRGCRSHMLDLQQDVMA